MIDLHTHSTASDGIYSPSDLVKLAASKGIGVLALTDHDSTSGLLEAQEEAKRQGIVFVPGIEVTITWPVGEFHLLGLGLTHTSRELGRVIEKIRRERVFRNKKMIEKLADFGIHLSYDEMLEKFGSENIGRPHFAQLMVEKGYVQNRQAAFDRFFAVGRPCYVGRDGADLYDAVEAIKSSGGVPVQAHPLSIYVSWGKIEETMEEIKDSGVMGLEAWHPAVRVSEAERLVELGKKMGLVVTGGSDFHGEKVRADRRLGFSAGKLKVPENLWYEELKPLLEKVHGGDSLEYGSA